MLKVVENCRPAVAFGRTLLICSLFAIVSAPRARADSYQYTVTFDSATYLSEGFKLTMAVSFVLPSLLDNNFASINASDVKILEAPIADAPDQSGIVYAPVASSLVSLIANNQQIGLDFLYQRPTGLWQRSDSYDAYFNAPITATGVYQPDVSLLSDATNGDNPIGESHWTYLNHGGDGDSVSIVATPEPNTGFLVGACFLCCAIIALLRRSA